MLRRGRAGLTALIALTLFFIFILALARFGTLAASAQGAAPVLETAELRLWPEYDDPGLLVIFAGQFVSETTFPLQVAFPAPTGIRNVQATYVDSSSSLINRPFEIADGQVKYELPSAGFQLEYYLDRAPSGEQRNITYSFVAPYAINTLRVEVQQPARSSSFTMTPASESSPTAADGLTYHVFNRRNIAAGETVDITISYAKSDTGLSRPQLAVAPSGDANQATAAAPAPASSADVLPWILIGLGILLLAGVLAYWLLSQRRQVATQTVTSAAPASVKPRPAASGIRPRAPARQSDEAAAYCTNCGNGLNAQDRFCSQCGAPRRS